MVVPSRRHTQVTHVLDTNDKVNSARTGQTVTLTLRNKIDINHNNIIATINNPPEMADQFAGHLL